MLAYFWNWQRRLVLPAAFSLLLVSRATRARVLGHPRVFVLIAGSIAPTWLLPRNDNVIVRSAEARRSHLNNSFGSRNEEEYSKGTLNYWLNLVPFFLK
ncbi:MAG: hypothetical protein JO331_06050 [Verrucomicrobia bacterium]|nr:hypothetical protein [Verrucomicrobiota bacterium]